MNTDILVALIGTATTIGGIIITHILTEKRTRRRMQEELEVERAKQKEALKIEHTKEVMNAYRQFLALLEPAADSGPLEERVIIRKDGQAYVNRPVAQHLFDDIQEFVYSDTGSFLSKKMRQKVIPDARKYIFNLFKEGEPDEETGWIPISNTKAKKAQNALNWIRHVALEEAEKPFE